MEGGTRRGARLRRKTASKLEEVSICYRELQHKKTQNKDLQETESELDAICLFI